VYRTVPRAGVVGGEVGELAVELGEQSDTVGEAELAPRVTRAREADNAIVAADFPFQDLRWRRGTFENSMPSPSAIVGCASTAFASGP
jgi:hypothetical protein